MLGREIRLKHREIDISSTSSTTTVTSVLLRTEFKIVAEMLNEFSHGEDEYFTNWKTQNELLKETYNLKENLMKLIIVRNIS